MTVTDRGFLTYERGSHDLVVRKTRDILASGGTPSGADAERHLGECATCADLMDRQADAWLAELDGGASNLEGSSDLDALFEQVQVSVDRDRGALGWLRSRSTPMRIAAALAVPAALVAFQVLTKLHLLVGHATVGIALLPIAAAVAWWRGRTF